MTLDELTPALDLEAGIRAFFLPARMRDEEIPALIQRECTICPPSRSIKCTHFDGLYVVMHTIAEDYVLKETDHGVWVPTDDLCIYVCAGHDTTMSDTWSKDGQHATEIVRTHDANRQWAEEMYEEYVQHLLAGTLAELLPYTPTPAA